MTASTHDAPRRALLTGGNRGLGLALAARLLERGDHLLATCRVPADADALAALQAAHPERCRVVALDVAAPEAPEQLVAAARDWLAVDGEDARIDLLVNNAGVLKAGERFGAIDGEDVLASLRINAVAPLLLTQALAPWLADDARVANISSQLGAIAGVTRFGTPSYAIGKAAQNMASAQLAQALGGRGIVVLALHPGWVRTDMGGSEAPLAPGDAAAGLLAVIDGARRDDNGRFLDHAGKPMPW